MRWLQLQCQQGRQPQSTWCLCWWRFCRQIHCKCFQFCHSGWKVRTSWWRRLYTRWACPECRQCQQRPHCQQGQEQPSQLPPRELRNHRSLVCPGHPAADSCCWPHPQARQSPKSYPRLPGSELEQWPGQERKTKRKLRSSSWRQIAKIGNTWGL